MTEEIKLLLGDSATNYTDAQIGLAYKLALAEVEAYCKREVEAGSILELMAENIAVIKLNRMGTQGLTSQSYSGVSESYIDGYPADIVAVLNSKRKIKVV